MSLSARFWEALVHSRRSPLIVMPLFALVFVFGDMAVNRVGGTVDADAGPDRLLAVALLAMVGGAWYLGVSERERRLDEIEAYQQRLHELSIQLAAGDAAERRALATRLHEDVSQQLAAGRLFLGGVAPDDDAARQALASVARILDRAMADCREIAEVLEPPVLGEFGLCSAIETLADRMRRRSGVDVVMRSCEVQSAVDSDVGGVTFQVAAEVLGFAAGDPQCEHVEVSCGKAPGSVVLAFDWDSDSEVDFFSARQRIRGIGGRFLFESGLGATHVELHVPASAA